MRNKLSFFLLLFVSLVMGCGKTMPQGQPVVDTSPPASLCGDSKVTGDEKCDTAISTGDGVCPTRDTCLAMPPKACVKSYRLSGFDCSRECVPQDVIRTCSTQEDGCCPPGCDGIDPDCKTTTPVCGDGKVTGDEKCDIGIHYLNDGTCPLKEFCEGYRRGEDDRGSCQIYKVTGEGCQQECTKVKDLKGDTTADCINDDGCCPGGACDATNDSDCNTTIKKLKYGDHCTYGKDYECPGPNPYCYTADPNNLGLAHCTTKCTDDKLCGDKDSLCVNVSLRDFGVCTLDCSKDPMVCKGDFICQKLKSGRSACVYEPLTRLKNAGAACTKPGISGDCGTEGFCFTGKNNPEGGYCSAACNSGDRCADGTCSVELDLGFYKAKYCGIGCTDGPDGNAACDAKRHGYVCSGGKCQPPPCTETTCTTPPCADTIKDDRSTKTDVYYKKTCSNGGTCYKTNLFGYVCSIP